MLETISLPITELMKSKIPLLLKESISIIYYLYEKPKIEWCMENDDDSE